MNQEQAYKPIYDSTPMNDFLYEVNRCISPKLNNNIRDNERIVSIKSRIEECKKALPPSHSGDFIINIFIG